MENEKQTTQPQEPIKEDIDIMGSYNTVEELMKNTWDAED